MKSIFSRILGILTIAIFVVLISVFILNLRQQQSSSTGNTQGQSGYPPPQNAAAQPSAYPPLAGEITNTQSQNSCENLGTWTRYSNAEAGYSLQYPAESELIESNNYISIYLKPGCYGQTCWGSNRIIVSIMDNPDILPLEEFVIQEFRLASAPPHNKSVQNFETSKSFVEVAGVQTLRIEQGVTFSKPDIFIPNNNQVIRIYVSADDPVPPHDPPCQQTLELLNEILATVELLSP